MVALIYIDRIIESRNVVLTALNVHRLLITSLMLAAKFFDDLFYNNAFYAKLGTLDISCTDPSHVCDTSLARPKPT